MRSKSFLAGLLCVLACITVGCKTHDLILVAGQSNAVGFDAYASQLPADRRDQEVLIWWHVGDPPPDAHDSTSSRQWTRLQPQPRGNPMPKTNGVPRQYGNFAKPEGGFGPEIGLARELRAKEGKPLAIIKVAFSGTAMRTDWNPADAGDGGACYRALVGETKAAIADAKARGTKLNLRALVWVQGESDANPTDAPNYEQALTAMLAALRKDLEAPELIALLGVNTHFGNDKNPHVAKIVEAQRAIAAKDERCVYVDTEGAETLKPSQTHFTAAGTLEVGRRFADALLRHSSPSPKPQLRPSLFPTKP